MAFLFNEFLNWSVQRGCMQDKLSTTKMSKKASSDNWAELVSQKNPWEILFVDKNELNKLWKWLCFHQLVTRMEDL